MLKSTLSSVFWNPRWCDEDYMSFLCGVILIVSYFFIYNLIITLYYFFFQNDVATNILETRYLHVNMIICHDVYLTKSNKCFIIGSCLHMKLSGPLYHEKKKHILVMYISLFFEKKRKYAFSFLVVEKNKYLLTFHD